MMHRASPSQRQDAYRAKFGTAHPRREQVLAGARELFPGRDLRLKTMKGQTVLLDGRNLLGIGSDPVEAVASADIAQKQLQASREAPPQTRR